MYSGPLAGPRRRDGNPERGLTCSTEPSECRAGRPETPAAGSSFAGSPATILIIWMSDIPLGVFTSVTGISGSGKSSLISQFLVEAVGDELGQRSRIRPTMTTAWKRMVETIGGEITERPGRESSGWWWSTRSRSAGRRGRIWRHIPVCSIMSASCSPPPSRPAPGGTMRAGSPSTLRRAVARHARAKGSSASNCSFCRACTRPVRPARARATTPRRWRSRSGTSRSPTCWR